MKLQTLLVVVFNLFLGTVSAFQALPLSRTVPYFNRHHVRESGLRSSSGDEEQPDYNTEEILMNIHLAFADGQNENAMTQISKYSRSFPFSVILPVQPLQYLPTSDGGVEVKFLRKKTDEKGSVDGGMRFFIKEERNGYDIVCKRNSMGQTGSKMFAEKLVVLAFVKGISGEEAAKTGAPPADVWVESVFHKWL
jgi:hypothetical protein